MKDPRVAEALDWLEKHSRKSIRDGMARYAIPNDTALGVRMGDIQKLAKFLGRELSSAAVRQRIRRQGVNSVKRGTR